MNAKCASLVSCICLTQAATAAYAAAEFEPFRFSGYSSRSVSGNSGYRELYLACQEDFGPRARACLSEEFIHDPGITVAEPPETGAWLLPVLVFSGGAGGVDFSGEAATEGEPGELSCDAWDEQSTSGLAVVAPGSIDVRACGQYLPVTCCIPPSNDNDDDDNDNDDDDDDE